MYDSLFSEGGLTLDRLRALIAVQDAGSIANTAPGDAVKHSLYSRQLRELSEFFGREVTHRRGKVLKLTPEGARLSELARPFLRGLADLHSECRNERAVFNIAAGDSLIHWLVIPRLGGLLKTLPHDPQNCCVAHRLRGEGSKKEKENHDAPLLQKRAEVIPRLDRRCSTLCNNRKCF